MSTAIRGALLPVLSVLLGACAGADLALNATPDDSGTENAEGSPLYLDIRPSDATPDLLAQTLRLPSFQPDDELVLQVQPSIELSGRVVAFQPTPFLPDPEVPGQASNPISATVRISTDSGIAQASTTTDADGAFRLRLPAGRGYSLLVVPEDNARAPFLLQEQALFSTSQDLGDLELAYGQPVWGTVRYSDGTVPDEVLVSLRQPETGSQGRAVTPDADGWFLLRALPGTYELRVEPQAGALVPSQGVTVEVDPESVEGVEVRIDLGPAARSRVSGNLVDSAGARISSTKDYRVRMSSQSLRDADGSYSLETRADQFGAFSLEVMPGDYLLEVIPAYEARRSPVSQWVTVGDEAVSLGEITVPDRWSWSGQVLDADGVPSPGALVVAQEDAFDRFTYSGVTGADGVIQLSLPWTPMTLSLTPADGQSAITYLRLDPAEEPPELVLDTGVPIRGRLLLDGQPVPYALIDVRDVDDTSVATTVSDAEGAFAMRIQESLLRTTRGP